MPRCGCASDQCSCFIVEGPNVTVTGSGTQNDPYVVSAATQVVDISGDPLPGTEDSHWIGEVIEYAGTSAPSADYVPADGRALSRAVYTTLFARLGTTYGAGDGSTTFNVPNLGGRVAVGSDGGHAAGATGGAETVALATGNLPAHTHAIDHTHAATSSSGTHDHNITRSDDLGIQSANIPRGTGTTTATSRGAIADDGAHTHTVPAYTGASGSVGSGTPVSTMPPYVAIPKYIRVQGGP